MLLYHGESDVDLAHVTSEVRSVAGAGAASASLDQEVGSDDTDLTFSSSVVSNAKRPIIYPVSTFAKETGELSIGTHGQDEEEEEEEFIDVIWTLAVERAQPGAWSAWPMPGSTPRGPNGPRRACHRASLRK